MRIRREATIVIYAKRDLPSTVVVRHRVLFARLAPILTCEVPGFVYPALLGILEKDPTASSMIPSPMPNFVLELEWNCHRPRQPTRHRQLPR
jgi:hypothetical protein